MQKKFTQPVISIEAKNWTLAGSSHKKFFKNGQKIDFSEDHIFMFKNMWAWTYLEGSFQIHSIYWNKKY